MSVRVTLEEQVGDLFDFRASITVDGHEIMRNAFQLTNVRSTTLTGGKKS
jgi:hypothetical protein